MPTTKMFRAIRPLKYLTRQLVAGDLIEAPYETKRDRMTVTALLASRKVREVRAPVDVPPPPPAVKAKIDAAVAPAAAGALGGASEVGAMTTKMFSGNDQAPPPDASGGELTAARTAYREVFGKAADARWSAATVRSKIAAKDESGS